MIARLRAVAGRLALLAVVSSTLLVPAPALAQTKIRVGWCAKTISSAATPFAVAAKMGWNKQDGIEVELVPLAGSGDCTKTVVTKEVLFALPSVEPLAAARPQGVKAKIFYTAYQGNIYGIAVPVDSPVHKMTDLKGKTIGVISMGSAGVQIAKALAATSGMDPNSDINVVVAGEGAQTAAMVRGKQVDALSQFDTQYAMVENAGVKLRVLDTRRPCARAPTMPPRWRGATPRARSSRSTIRRRRCGSCTRCTRRPSPPARTRPPRTGTTSGSSRRAS
jgi:NitT/TauT family transport system substrate-binding protein